MTVGRQYVGFTRLDIDQLLSIATQGREIQSLSVEMYAPGGRSQATLLEGGRPTGPMQWVGDYSAEYTFDVQYGGSHTALELQLNGPVYIQSITAWVSNDSLQPPGWPQRPVVLEQYVGQSFRGAGTLDLFALTGLYNYQGMRVTRVILRGSSTRGVANAELQINRIGQDQVILGSWSQDHNFYPYGLARIGYEIQDLGFWIRGDASIDSVTVELAP